MLNLQRCFVRLPLLLAKINMFAETIFLSYKICQVYFTDVHALTSEKGHKKYSAKPVPSYFHKINPSSRIYPLLRPHLLDFQSAFQRGVLLYSKQTLLKQLYLPKIHLPFQNAKTDLFLNLRAQKFRLVDDSRHHQENWQGIMVTCWEQAGITHWALFVQCPLFNATFPFTCR